MSPSEVIGVRTRLNMGVARFAALLNVYPATIHRWEGLRPGSINPLHRGILTYIKSRLDERAEEANSAWVAELNAILLTKGSLGALAFVLKDLRA